MHSRISSAVECRPIVGRDFKFDERLVWATTTRGTRYQKVAWSGMPKIPRELLDATFYLYPDRESAEAGADFGGTGFLLARHFHNDPTQSVIYAVTNYHVAIRDGCSVIRLNHKDGSTEILEFGPEDWTFISNGPDIAAVALSDMSKVISTAISIEMLALPPEIERYEIGPGDNVFMVGRFVDHGGKVKNEPAVRFGHLSMMPLPMKQKGNGAVHKSYCIDMHSRSGYSGSPVFCYRTMTDYLAETSLVVDSGRQFIALLGIHWGQFPEEWELGTRAKSAKPDVSVEGDERYIVGMSGMTCVAPASDIVALLETGRLQSDFEEIEAYLARSKSWISVPRPELPPFTHASLDAGEPG